MSESKLDLPDPGNDRYWEVEATDEWLTLKLKSDALPVGAYWTDPGVEVAVGPVIRAVDATAAAFKTIAEDILATQVKVNEFVGVYRTTEETN